ncbi:heme o synthase [Euzebya tangerina]|uniref:heme o synthase n=1 Tax=Euzebya tangerina TaxID=591198 RepID=UPI000E3201C1|nr:heme o synthase [Euzebya tangerina]
MSHLEAAATAPTDPRGSSVGDVVRAYVAVTKPRIVELLLVTTLPAMIVAERGLPPAGLILATLLGGTLGAGSANAFNSIIERDSDALMQRTSRRPLPNHAISTRAAVLFASILAVVSFVVTTLWVNLLTAALILAANAFYVLVYTAYLKPRTVQNIVIGGAAGCVPVLAGWSAVTGELSLTAWLMFAVVFLWTPPHFWALAIRYREDYAAASIPMLPVVAGTLETTRQIIGYTVLMVVFTLALGLVAEAGVVYLVVALLLGARFVQLALRLHRAGLATDDPGDSALHAEAMATFRYSIGYLGLVLFALAAGVVF